MKLFPLSLVSLLALSLPLSGAKASLILRQQTSHQHNTTAAFLPQLRPYVGTYDAAYVYVGIASDGLNTAAPVTYQIELPAGLSFARHAGSNWDCEVVEARVTCTSLATIPPAIFGPRSQLIAPPEGEIQIYVDVAPSLAPDTPLLMRGIAFNIDHPHDPQGACTAANNCIEEPSQTLASWLKPAWMPNNNPVIAPGATRVIPMLADLRGYNVNNGAAKFTLVLPPAIGLDSVSFLEPLTGWTCAPTALPGGGTRAECTTAALHNPTTAPYGQTISAPVGFTMDADTPLGTWHAVAIMMELAEQPPVPDCNVAPIPMGCAVLWLTPGGSNAARLEILREPPSYPWGMLAVPAVFSASDPINSIGVRYINRGTGSAGEPVIDVQLPPGLSFVSEHNSNPAATCTASGSSASGQHLRCLAGALSHLEGSNTGLLSLQLDADDALPYPIASAISAIRTDTSTSLTNSLLDCTAAPEQPVCGRIDIPVTEPLICGVADGVFCNGYE